MIRTAAPGMERELRCLWQTCFGEPARPVNLYLRNVFRPENCLVSLCGDRVASALHLLPCRIQLPDGKTAPAHYVYAVATFPEFRGRGLVLELLPAVLYSTAADCVCRLPRGNGCGAESRAEACFL